MLAMRGGFTQYQYGVMAILFASVLWGTTGVAASFAPGISPLGIGAFAMGVGGMMLAILARRKLKANVANLLQQKTLLLLSALALAIYPLAFYSSMRMAGVAVGTVVSIASAPLFAALLECLFSKAFHLTKRWLISVLIGLIGIALLAYGEPHATEIAASGVSEEQVAQQRQVWGIALGLLAGLTYAFYSWAARTMIDNGVHSQAAMGSIFGLGAMVLLPSLFFTGDNLFSSPGNALVSLYMALIPMTLGYIAFGYGLRHIKASSASLLTLMEPVVAAILAVLIVGEVISPLGWFGMLLIMLCLLIQATEKQPVATVAMKSSATA
ncbi:DMT family transporter [Paraglaciecola sp. T6c]|uniref:DMT family transporter n=1 Tax=Pseudoalteromonas atlantica (strain T6c / ATCC BAA-1087) TaxID=3042615 RepID=UPI0005A0F66B|nr:EamA family transporter [Paraglaciecola sp. T6c]